MIDESGDREIHIPNAEKLGDNPVQRGGSSTSIEQVKNAPSSHEALALLAGENQSEEEQSSVTGVQKYLKGLEDPHDGDVATIREFNEEFYKREDEANDRGEKPPKYEDLLRERPDVQSALARRDNPELKRILPGAVEVVKRLVEEQPDMDLDKDQRKEKKETPEFYAARAKHLQRILDLDLQGTPAGDGSLGEHGEVLLFNLIVSCSENNLFDNALYKTLARHKQSADATHSSVNEGQAFLDQAGRALKKLEEISRDKLEQREQRYVAPPNLDYFGEQVDPLYYLRYRRERYFGASS